MIRRIDLFMPPISQYGVLHHFTKKIAEAFVRLGVNCRILEAERDNPRPFLTQLFNDPPDCTLSFNGLLPDAEGRFFCDMIRIPHVACLVDSPNHFFPLIQSPYTIITCVDRFSCDFFRGMNFDKVYFMPHGVEKNLAAHLDEERKYDVLMLASCIDYDEIAKKWPHKYPGAVSEAMFEAVDITFSDQRTSYVQAFVQAMDRQVSKRGAVSVNQNQLVGILDDLEHYIRGVDRIELVKALKGIKIDIFGQAKTKHLWEKYLGKKHQNITFHDAVPYEKALDLMKEAKVLLNSCPWIKDGTHERILAGLACGALVLTNDNIYMDEHFKDGESILYYRYNHREKAAEKVKAALADENKREEIVHKGRELVMRGHTWDHRAARLLRELDLALKKIANVRK